MSEILSLPWALGGFTPGSPIAGYRLEEQIGHGGMAIVFRAHDERLNRRVALKILAPALAADVAFRQRFIRESQAAAAVDDPHIIPVFEAGEAGGVLFIAMRLVRGGDLRSLVALHGPLAPARAEWIVSAVASALDAAHAAGLVHRDVKPANMLLDRRAGRPDHVYLSDFGLSKSALGSSSLTGSGHFLGTIDYAAPEQLEGRDVDGRTDQYALGCSAFELLCGRPPFKRDQGLAAVYAHLSEPPPSLTALRSGLRPEVDRVFAKVLAKTLEGRYPTCQDFAEHLRAALGIQPYATEGADGFRERSITDVVWTGIDQAAAGTAEETDPASADAPTDQGNVPGDEDTGGITPSRPVDQQTTGVERHTNKRRRAGSTRRTPTAEVRLDQQAGTEQPQADQPELQPEQPEPEQPEAQLPEPEQPEPEQADTQLPEPEQRRPDQPEPDAVGEVAADEIDQEWEADQPVSEPERALERAPHRAPRRSRRTQLLVASAVGIAVVAAVGAILLSLSPGHAAPSSESLSSGVHHYGPLDVTRRWQLDGSGGTRISERITCRNTSAHDVQVTITESIPAGITGPSHDLRFTPTAALVDNGHAARWVLQVPPAGQVSVGYQASVATGQVTRSRLVSLTREPRPLEVLVTTPHRAIAIRSLKISPPRIRLAAGQKVRAHLSGVLTNGRSAPGTDLSHPVWKSANARVATVSSAGTVTGVGPGRTRITAAIGAVRASVLVMVGRAQPSSGTSYSAPSPSAQPSRQPSSTPPGHPSSHPSTGPTTITPSTLAKPLGSPATSPGHSLAARASSPAADLLAQATPQAFLASRQVCASGLVRPAPRMSERLQQLIVQLTQADRAWAARGCPAAAW